MDISWVWSVVMVITSIVIQQSLMWSEGRRFSCMLNTLRPRQNGRHFADDTFNRIFVNENVRISIEFSLKFVPKGPINNIPALVQIMAWRRSGDKPLSEPKMVSLPTHICVTRPQWVNCVIKIIWALSLYIFHPFYARMSWWQTNCNSIIFFVVWMVLCREEMNSFSSFPLE